MSNKCYNGNMKSLEARFREIEIKNPLWSTFVVFVAAVNGQNFAPKIISKWFLKLVDKDDYNQEEKKALMKWIEKQNFSDPVKK